MSSRNGRSDFVDDGIRSIIDFYTPDGVTLNGELMLTCLCPAGMNLVLVPGGSKSYSVDKQTYLFQSVATKLASCGFPVFLYEGRGFDPEKRSKRLTQRDSVEDLKGVLDNLRAGTVDGWCPEKPVGLLAFSAGGAAALEVSSLYPEIKAILCYGTLPSYRRAFDDGRTLSILKYYYRNSGFKSFEQFVDHYNAMEPVSSAANVNCHVRLAGGLDDKDFFRLDEQMELASALVNARSVSILGLKGWNHSLSDSLPNFHAEVEGFANWFKSCVSPEVSE